MRKLFMVAGRADAIDHEEWVGVEAVDDPFFEIGSVTKTFTALLLLRLADAGCLGLDDRVSDHLPVSGGCEITLRSLANHTSGLPRLPPGTSLRPSQPYAAFTPERLGEAVAELPRYVSHRRAARATYSNFGYAVLGAVVESVSGESWYSMLSQHVLVPMEIDTEVRLFSGVPGGRANLARAPWELGALVAAGGLWSTRQGLVRYAQDVALHDPRAKRLCWQFARGFDWHNGATRDAACFIGAHPGTRRWVVACGSGLPAVDLETKAVATLEED